MDARKRVIGDPRGAKLATLGHPCGNGEGDRDRRGFHWQHGDLVGQEVGELGEAKSGGQRQRADSTIAGHFPAPIAGVESPIWSQTPQPIEEQLDEIWLEVLDGDMRFGGPAHRQVHPDFPARATKERSRGLVGERLGSRMTLFQCPAVEHRENAHVLAPGARHEPLFPRTACPVLGITAQSEFQAVPCVEHIHPVLGEELHPLLDGPRIAFPRVRRRCATGGQLSQPAVHHHCRPRCTRPVLEPEILVDQHRHPLGDQRPVRDIPGVPALGREETQDHGQGL